MTSYLVADFDEADFPVELTLNWYQEGTYKMKAAKTSGTAPGNLKAVTYSMEMCIRDRLRSGHEPVSGCGGKHTAGCVRSHIGCPCVCV